MGAQSRKGLDGPEHRQMTREGREGRAREDLETREPQQKVRGRLGLNRIPDGQGSAGERQDLDSSDSGVGVDSGGSWSRAGSGVASVAGTTGQIFSSSKSETTWWD